MAKTAEMLWSDDRRKEEKSCANGHFSSTVFSSGTSSGDRTLGVLRVALREEAEGRVGRRWLVPEELEKHLILNSNRLRTFEDARLEGRDVRGGEIWFQDP